MNFMCLFFCTTTATVGCTGYRHFWDAKSTETQSTFQIITAYLTDTGQTSCYNDISGQACGDPLFPRQDGDLLDVPHARSYGGPIQHATFMNDYVTVDNVSGLVWKSCSEGLSGASCSIGTAAAIDWAIASTGTCQTLNTANTGTGFAGRRDWRLPNIEELKTLRTYSGSNPATDTVNFPGTLADDYWSATPDQSSPTQAWKISFIPLIASGTSTIAKASSIRVRCVAGSRLATNAKRDNGDGTVTDFGTNLFWQKCSMGQISDSNCTGISLTNTWQNSLLYCANLTLGAVGQQWRLPNINELGSITDFSTTNPAIAAALFPNTASIPYWSATTYAGQNSGWWVNFSSGAISDGCCDLVAKSNVYAVRCVASRN